MRGTASVVGLLLLGVVLTACGDAGPPLPAEIPAADWLPGVRFGLSPLELEELRRSVALDDEGIYREELDYATTASFGFLPWDEGRAPGREARLAGVEVRQRARDPRTLGRMWDEATQRATDPTCTAASSFRLVRWTATALEPTPDAAGDSIRITWVAEIITAGDGQGHEAYLSTRLETLDFAARAPVKGAYGRGRHPTRDRTVACDDVSAETLETR